MVYIVGVVATVCLGLGWVLQQRVAEQATEKELSLQLLLHLMSQRSWWFGVGAMVTGAALGGWALQLGAVTLVEPLLSLNLLFAFVFAALLGRATVKWAEVAGAVMLSAGLGIFIAFGNPHAARHLSVPSGPTDALAIGVVIAVAVLLIRYAKRRQAKIEAALIATGAGVMYGLQDVATRSTLVATDQHGLVRAFETPWPYVVIGAAAVGIALSQSAFHAARLDYSLPPTAAAEPLTGIALGIAILGDQVTVGAGATAFELLCLVSMVAGVILIGRSDTLVHGFAHLRPHQHEHEHQHSER